jgi:hypothetical protein
MQYYAPRAIGGREREDLARQGDWWVEQADRFKGTELEVRSLEKALNAYANRFRPGSLEKALPVAIRLREQRIDPKTAWQEEFADVNVLARLNNAQAAHDALKERLDRITEANDLTNRLDLTQLAQAMVKGNMVPQLAALIKQLQTKTFTRDDNSAIELMLANVYSKKNNLLAARHMLNYVYLAHWPSMRQREFWQAIFYLKLAKQPTVQIAELQKYSRAVVNAQDIKPTAMYQLGMVYLNNKSAAAMQIRRELVSRYPASEARKRLDAELSERIQKQRQKAQKQ